MKLQMGKNSKRKSGYAILALMLSLSMSLGTFAQDDLLDETDDILNSDQIDIDGNFKRKTQADKLEEMRKKLERQNEEMVQKKIEDIRMKEERKLSKKLKKAFSGQNISNVEDSVSTVQAAPQKVVTEAPSIEEEGDIRIIPSFGVLSYSGETSDLESKINAGLAVEAKVSNRFTVGLGFNYTTMDLMDIGNGGFGNYGGFNYNGFQQYYAPTLGYNYGYNTNYYNQNYYSAFGTQGREMNYKNLSIEINSKFMILPDSKIRPYLGVGISYNRANLTFADGGESLNGQSYTFNTFKLGDENFRANYIGASAVIGAEILFTKNVGMNLDLKYQQALTEGYNAETQTFLYNPDQEALEAIGKDIHKSSIFGLSAGLIVAF